MVGEIYLNYNNMKQIKLTWKCVKCNDIVISYSDVRHNINFCKCGESGVDLEEWYQRNTGNIKELKREEFIDNKWISI